MLDSLKNSLPLINRQWDEEIIPVLMEYVQIPNKSPMFDNQWKAHGYMDQALKLIIDWCKKQPIKGMKIDVLESENRTPLLLIDIPSFLKDENVAKTVLLYGHMDKQPEMTGWDEDLGPWKPVIKGDKLYGRGAADDGYSSFCALSAIGLLQKLSIPHDRCVVLIEGSEESGSVDLPYYLEKIKERLDTPSLIICLDSDSGNYDQMWGTTSLRGICNGILSIGVLKQGIHSGFGGGVVPTTFMILRQLMDRIEDPKTGKLTLKDLYVKIPQQRLDQAKVAATAIGEQFFETYPFLDTVKPISEDIEELILNRSWRPALTITGVRGIPAIENGGNVTLPVIAVNLSLRLPPSCDAKQIAAQMKAILEKDPPFGAQVSYQATDTNSGWEAPAMSPWLIKAADEASQLFFNRVAAYSGGGGTIPFMGILGKMFPQAQFMITGILGPNSNAHGPNEFLHIPMVKKLTGCVAALLALQAKQ